MKKVCVLLCMGLAVPAFAQSNRAGSIVSIKGQEIQVKNEHADAPFMAGERLRLLTGDQSVVLEVTFPMQTVAKCRLVAGNLSALRAGMFVVSGKAAPQTRTTEERSASAKIDSGKNLKDKDEAVLLSKEPSDVKPSSDGLRFLLNAKVGGAYAFGPNEPGINVMAEIGIGFNRYLEALLMTGYSRCKWKETVTTVYSSTTFVDAYSGDCEMYPVLVGGKIRFPKISQLIGITPYISAGAGYSWVKYANSVTSANGGYSYTSADDDFYSGFTWIASAGMEYRISDTKVSLIFEGGYRRAKLENMSDSETGPAKLDMSGVIADIGCGLAF